MCIIKYINSKICDELQQALLLRGLLFYYIVVASYVNGFDSKLFTIYFIISILRVPTLKQYAILT